jgi:type IV pilus assembly protein PilQ
MRANSYLAAFLLGVALACQGASHEGAPGASNAIESIGYATLPAGRGVLRVALRDPLAEPPSGFRVLHPVARIVLEFPRTTVAARERSIRIESGVLRAVHLVQRGSHARLVLHLDRPVGYETQVERNVLTIFLDAPRAATGEERTAQFTAPAGGAAPHRIRNVAFRRGADREGRVIVTLSDPRTPIEVGEQGQLLVVDFRDTDLAEGAAARFDVLDFATPIASFTIRAAGRGVRLVIEPLAPFRHAAFQAGDEFVVSVAPPARPPGPEPRWR